MREQPHFPSHLHRGRRGASTAQPATTVGTIDTRFVDDAADAIVRAGRTDVLDAIPHLVATLSPDGRLLSVNRAGREMLGVGTAEPPSGVHFAAHVPEPWRDGFVHEVLPAAVRQGVWQGELAILGPDGEDLPIVGTLVAQRDESGALASLVMFARDVSERRRFEAQIVYFVDHDRLTGLYNRSRFHEEVARALRASGSEGPGAVVVIDVDGFRRVNERIGSGASDDLLADVAGLLRLLPAPAVAARLEGDAFAILLPAADAPEAVGFAERIRHEIAETARTAGCDIGVTASAGVALLGGPDDEAGRVIARAERALEEAKRGGGDRARLAGPVRRSA